MPFFKIPDTYVLNNCTIDGFFFIRYLKVIRNICFVGCLLCYTILFPINATGGKHLSQLSALTIGNVADPNKMYAHLFVAWVFFGMYAPVTVGIVANTIDMDRVRSVYDCS